MRKLNRGYLYNNKVVLFVLSFVDSLLSIFPYKRRPIPSQIDRILLIKPDHLGDMLLATSIFAPLKKKYPHAIIDMLCQPSSASLLVGNPSIRRVYCIDHWMHVRTTKTIRFWISYFHQFFRTWRCCRKEKYDLCLLLRAYGGNFILLGRLIGSKCLIGHGTGGFGSLLDLQVSWKEGVHEVEHFHEVLAPLGITSSIQQGTLFFSAEDERYVDQLCLKHGLGDFIVIHPFAGDKRKMVDEKLWLKLIRVERQVILCGGPRDEMPNVAKHCINLIGQLSIQRMYLLFKRATKIYTLDSLSGHVAALSGTETEIICKKAVYFPEWRPIGKNVKINLTD